VVILDIEFINVLREPEPPGLLPMFAVEFVGTAVILPLIVLLDKCKRKKTSSRFDRST